MQATSVTVAIPVSDLAVATAWYDVVLDRSAEFEPLPGIVEYEFAGTWVQLVSGRQGSRGWVFGYGVENISVEHDRLERAGIGLGDIKTVPGVILFFDFRDPDDNELSAYQVLSQEPEVP
jgi:predicted enzyme related to lactoylglutathione lyase